MSRAPQPAVPSPKDVLGLPLLPPARLAAGGNRLRAGVGRLQRATAPPAARVMETALAGLEPAALATACRLDLPDRLRTARSIDDLAAELTVDPMRLERLVRYLAARGWVRYDRAGRVRSTRALRFLRRDHPGGWRAWIEFVAGDEVRDAVAGLDAGLSPGGDAFEAINERPFFDWMAAHPDRHRTFDAAMAAGGRMHGLLLARTLDWTTTRRVCDVGGGDGSVLGVLLAAHPHLHGTLLDLPEVVARVTPRPRLTTVGGDAFSAVPHGCDTHLFVNVLHDWDDDACVRLLTRSTEALPGDAGARVVVVETASHDRPRDDLAVRADLLMLALTPGGRERSTAHLAQLAQAAGLRHRGAVPLVSGDLAHELTR